MLYSPRFLFFFVWGKDGRRGEKLVGLYGIAWHGILGGFLFLVSRLDFDAIWRKWTNERDERKKGEFYIS